MNFFNIDLHAAVIEDFKYISKNIENHKIYDNSLSAHAELFNKPIINNGVINQNNWKEISPDFGDRFVNVLGSTLDKQIDCFVVGFPNSFYWLYSKMDKPIIMISATRYEHPFGNNKEKWIEFNEAIKKDHTSGKLKIIANSLYDKYYFESFTECEVDYIPSLCEYTNMKWTPSIPKFLAHDMGDIIPKHPRIQRVNMSERYEWSDIQKALGIIFIPYNASVMKFFEYYTAGIPMLFPTMSLLNRLKNSEHQLDIMSQLSFNELTSASKIPGWGSKSIIGWNEKKTNLIDPNDFNNPKMLDSWSKFFDFNRFKYLIRFDSFEELHEKIESLNIKTLQMISEKMLEESYKIKNIVYEKWRKIIC